MDSSTHKKSTIETRTFAVVALVMVSTTAFSSEPASKPTPRPGTLAAYAEKKKLKRSTLGEKTDRIVLTNDNVVVVGASGSIIVGGVSTNRRGKTQSTGAADRAERARWRAAYRKQRIKISSLEGRRSQLEIEIDHLENQRLTIKTMARLQLMEAKLEQLDRDLASERAELSRIVREARQRGAEPGWFR